MLLLLLLLWLLLLLLLVKKNTKTVKLWPILAIQVNFEYRLFLVAVAKMKIRFSINLFKSQSNRVRCVQSDQLGNKKKLAGTWWRSWEWRKRMWLSLSTGIWETDRAAAAAGAAEGE